MTYRSIGRVSPSACPLLQAGSALIRRRAVTRRGPDRSPDPGSTAERRHTTLPGLGPGGVAKRFNGRGGSIGRAATWVGFGRLLVAKWKVNENDDASDHSIIAC
jgi:hypothetical protein